MSEQAASELHPNKHFYDRISGVYDSLADANEHTAREAGEALLGLKAGESVLEIGFGTGNTLLHLAEAVGPEGRACGVDVSDGMRDVAMKKVSDAGFASRVELKVSNAVELPWTDDTFDAVFLSFTLELFSPDDLPTVLSEVRRVLKPNGRIADVSMATPKKDAGETTSLLEKTYVWMHQHFPHIVDCRPIDPARELRAAGFDITTEQRLQIWSMPVAAVLATNNKPAPHDDFAI